jgi:L-alanine-DL-glutamate epimerase-like enolase superfamily enzyme
MILSDLEFFLVEIPREESDTPVRSLVVRLATDQGVEGWGEAQLNWRASELGPRRDVLLPVLAGRTVFDIEDLLTLDVLRPAPLRAAMEIASWDIVARIARQPLHRLMGGAYRPRIPLSVRLSGQTTSQVARVAREMADQGFHSQIITATGDPGMDCGTAAEVREIVGRRTELRFDAAGGYDLDTARRLCREMEDVALRYVLDPLAGDQWDDVLALRRQTSVPLAVRRTIQHPADMLALFRCGAAHSAVVDLQLVGGLIAARKCGAIAQAAGIFASLGGGPSLGINVAAMLQVAAATPAFSGCNECAYHELQDDLLAEPLDIADGMIGVPQGPGLGVEIDRVKLEKWQLT